MDRRGLWDKNSSLGPGQAPHSYTNVQQATGPASRPGSRSTSPRETVGLPSVELKFRHSAPPSSIPASSVRSAEVLSASSPRQQAESSCTGQVESALVRLGEIAVGMDSNGTNKIHHDWPNELALPKEKTHKKKRRVRDEHVRPPTIVDPSNPHLPLIRNGSLRRDGLPLDSQCDHCGVMFNGLSIAHHMKWCSRQQPRALKLQEPDVKWKDISAAPEKPLGNVVARVITVGLAPGKYEEVLIRSNEEHVPRPMTRTLPRSALQDTGHGLPLSNGEVSEHSKYEQCKDCGNIVSADKVGVHRRLCHGNPPIVNSGTLQFPSTHNMLKAGHKLVQTKPGNNSLTSAMPPTIVCYICGRKYGSHSISIHEPQCLKKFNAQNSKLPISERLPLPKKHGSVARVLLREEEVLVVARRPRVDMGSAVESKEELVQQYFESCYSEFEKELVPCKTCGRTFAPERHRKHEPSCNAKPLKLL